MDIIDSLTSWLPAWMQDEWVLDLLLFGYPLFKFLTFVLWAVAKHLLPMPDLKKRYCDPEKQSWAVVTGATDGIGLGFCKVLTRMGFNIVLISRNPAKLHSTVDLLEGLQKDAAHKAQFKIVPFDFVNSAKKELVDELVRELEGLDICLLVNNVGANYLGNHVTASHARIVDLLNVNCTSMAVLTSRLVRAINARKQKGGIINLSSMAGDRGIPFMAIYSASKSFTNKLSEGLSFEYPKLDILSLRPVLVESNMSKAKRGRFVPSGEEYALESLKELVFERESHGTLSHQIIGYIYQGIPDFLFRRIIPAILGKLFMSKRKN